MVPFYGTDPKTDLPWCSLEALQDVVRENEIHIDKSKLDEPEISSDESKPRHTVAAVVVAPARGQKQADIDLYWTELQPDPSPDVPF
jgi:hypothetical protein